MKAPGLMFLTLLTLTGCTTARNDSPEPGAKSAGYQIFTPRGGVMVYTQDLVLPVEPRLSPAQAADIEKLIAAERLAEAWAILNPPPATGTLMISALMASGGIERAKDFVRFTLRNRSATTAPWNPTGTQIAAMEAAMGDLFAHPDSRIGGFPARPPHPLASYQLVYSGVIKDGVKLIAGLARDPGPDASPGKIIAAYGGDASATRDQNATGGDRSFPRGGFVAVYNSDTGKIVLLNFQGGM